MINADRNNTGEEKSALRIGRWWAAVFDVAGWWMVDGGACARAANNNAPSEGGVEMEI